MERKFFVFITRIPLLFLQLATFFLLGKLVYAAGVNYGLDDSANYDVRYNGLYSQVQLDGDYLGGVGGILIGDVNGDGVEDLVLSATGVGGLDDYSGSVYVVFGGETSGDKPFSTESNYNIRFDGAAADDSLSSGGAIAIGDVNGDGKNDLIIGTYGAGNNGTNSGSVWVIFSTLIDDVGVTTGNNKPLATTTNYNIRYDGGAAQALLSGDGAVTVGDVNGDSLTDLVLGAKYAAYEGDQSGSVYVFFSTLIDDVGATTGNIKSLATTTNYNIRYDGGYTNNVGDVLSAGGAIVVDDVNGDDNTDLILGGRNASNSYSQSGSVWVMFSTLIDDVVTTGNNKPLATAGNYNIRYDGEAINDRLSYTTSASSTPIKTGDVNADGLKDLIIGTPNTEFGGIDAGSTYVFFSTLIDDVGVTTGNDKPLTTTTNYNIRYDGAAAGDNLSYSEIGDVNGDGDNDLVITAEGTANGSVYVFFSTLIDDVGVTTGNIKSVATAGNYNILYYGSGDELLGKNTQIEIGDLNGDSLPDLVIGTNATATPYDYGGAAYVFFSTLIDDVGITTGNAPSLASTDNYSIRYDGAAIDDELTLGGAIKIGDLNTDDSPDLILGTDVALEYAGSAWIIYSPPLSTPTSTPTPTPTVTPTPTASTLSTAGAPICTTEEPGSAPYLYAAKTVSFNEIQLYFNPADDPVDGYALEYGYGSGDYIFSATSIGGKDTTSYTVNSLSPGTTYYFRIRAGNGCSVGSWSSEISATTSKRWGSGGGLEITSTKIELPEQKETPKETPDETYDLSVKILDGQSNPLDGAKVTLHSNPRIAYTNNLGIAEFNDVEKGQHNVAIEYDGQEGKQEILLEGEVNTINLTINVQLTPIKTSKKIGNFYLSTTTIIIGSIVFLTLLSIFLFREKILAYLRKK